MMKIIFTCLAFLVFSGAYSQNWENLNSLYAPLPASVQVYRSVDSLYGKPNIMYYVEADLQDKNLIFTSDTTKGRRLTPSQFYIKNDSPLLVVNTSFFSFNTHRNLNIVVKDGKILSYNQHNIKRTKGDSVSWLHPFYSALGIFKNRTADVAWVYSDTTKRSLFATQTVVPALPGPSSAINYKTAGNFKRWKVKTAVGGGPVLLQNGEVKITNDEELKFAGKAIDDLHPRTAIGYTNNGKLIVFVCEGRSDSAAGLSLVQMAKILKGLGCEEALNLDGGGSSCLLVNGKETNTPSSKGVQRAVPSVFLIERR